MLLILSYTHKWKTCFHGLFPPCRPCLLSEMSLDRDHTIQWITRRMWQRSVVCAELVESYHILLLAVDHTPSSPQPGIIAHFLIKCSSKIYVKYNLQPIAHPLTPLTLLPW